MRDLVVLVVQGSDVASNRFIAFNVSEAHDLVCRILSGVEKAKGWTQAQEMRDVGTPKPVPVKQTPRRKR